jgi:hypothetical protein
LCLSGRFCCHSGNPCQTSVAFVASWFLSLVFCIDRAVDLGLEFLRFCVFSALSFESGVDERCMYYLLRDFEKIWEQNSPLPSAVGWW